MRRILLIPPWINLLITRNQGLVLKIGLLALILITAIYTKEYRGEYQTLINSHIGGIFYVLFGTLLISVFFPALGSWQAAVIALCCTSVLEFIQYFRFPFLVELTRSKFFLYLLGNSFNWKDFVYYAIGCAVGLILLGLLNYRDSVKSEE